MRQKAQQNLKMAKGTGGGPNAEQKLSATEEAIYALAGMKESVEGVSDSFGLGSSKRQSVAPPLPSDPQPPLPLDPPPPLPESDFGAWVENNGGSTEEDTPQKPPPKRFKKSAQCVVQQALLENMEIQKQMLKAMVEQQAMTKKVYRSIDRLYDLKKAESRELKRHHLKMEQFRLREVE